MRVLHIQAQLPSHTGSGIYFSNVVKGLKGKVEQAVVYGAWPGYTWDILPQAKQYACLFPNEAAAFPMPGMSDVMPYETSIYGDMTPAMLQAWKNSFAGVIKEAVAQFQPDVILCHHLWLLTAQVAATYPEHTVWAISHGTDIRQAQQHPNLVNEYLDGLKQLDRIFLLSAEQIRDVEAIFKLPTGRLSVLGSGFDAEIFYLPKEKPATPLRVIYAGKIAEAKGVYASVAAFKQLEDPAVEYHLYGNGDVTSLKRLREAIGKNTRIYYQGAVPQTELAEAMRASHIFLLPSYYEGLPLVIAEAMACGCYAIVGPFPALKASLAEPLMDAGLVEYVTLPPLKNADEPLPQAVPAYKDRLTAALNTQIKRVQAQPKLAWEMEPLITSHSWAALIDSLEIELKKVSCP